jgi:hypothetical protein
MIMNLYQNRINERCELFLPMGQCAEFPVIVCHYWSLVRQVSTGISLAKPKGHEVLLPAL